MHLLRILIYLGMILLGACSSDFTLAIPPGASVEVVELPGSIERTLDPGTERYKKLNAWLAANGAGWNRYYATPREPRLVVRAGELDLEFHNSTAVLHTRAGFFSKQIVPSEVAFLRGTGEATPR